jgi:hypothetical protein
LVRKNKALKVNTILITATWHLGKFFMGQLPRMFGARVAVPINLAQAMSSIATAPVFCLRITIPSNR